MENSPSYVKLHESGELAARIEKLTMRLGRCDVCPLKCGVNRLAGERGRCRSGRLPAVSSFGPHFGEERPLVGSRGSGTVFMTSCNLACVFCQNHDISQSGDGGEVGAEELGQMMLSLKKRGCHNINFVTPTHQVPQIVEALPWAVERGLDVPLVYNSGGYDDVETLKLLDGVFDIYMPDFKFGDSRTAQKLCGVPHYERVARAALVEMHRQAGTLKLDENGVAVRGLLVRHLVLPGGLASTEKVVRFIAEELSPETCVNIMDQYRPCHRAREYPELGRRITAQEFAGALAAAREAGLTRLDGR